MKLNFRAFYPFVLPLAVLALVWVAGDVLAVGGTSNETGSDGTQGKQLAIGLYCGTRALLEGYIGLLLGLILVVLGIWSLIKGASFQMPLILILFGSIITAVPGLIEVTMTGFGNLLNETKLSSTTFRAPTCNTTTTGHYENDPASGTVGSGTKKYLGYNGTTN